MPEVLLYIVLSLASYLYLLKVYLPFLSGSTRLNRKGGIPFPLLSYLKTQKTLLLTVKRSFLHTKIIALCFGGLLFLWALASVFYIIQCKQVVRTSKKGEKVYEQIKEV